MSVGWGIGSALGGIATQSQASGMSQQQQQVAQHNHAQGYWAQSHVSGFPYTFEGQYYTNLKDFYKAVAKKYFEEEMKEVIDE